MLASNHALTSPPTQACQLPSSGGTANATVKATILMSERIAGTVLVTSLNGGGQTLQYFFGHTVSVNSFLFLHRVPQILIQYRPTI